MPPIYTFIKERYALHLRFLKNPLFSRVIPIILSVWILGLTAYYCINAPWHIFFSIGQPDTKQLIAEALEFHWVPIFLSRLPYVFYALILNFIALLMGNRILRWLRVDFDSNLTKIIFSIPLGWGVYSIGIFWLGISGLLYKEAVYCFLTLLGILSILEIKRFFKPPHPIPLPHGERIKVRGFKIDKTDLIFLPVIIIFLAVQLVTSFSPVWSADALVYHVALPKLYIKHHALVHVPGFFYSTLPAHTEMLYLLGLITSGEILSKLLSLSISALFLISIFSIGNRYLSKGAGYLAALIMMLSVPYFFPLFSEPWADTALGLCSLLGVYAFLIWMEQGKEGYLYLSIICCASAGATKIQGLFFVPLFFVGFLVTVKQSSWQAGNPELVSGWQAKRLAWCILAVGIIALPWYIRSWWLMGDPVFPFLYKYLGAKHWNEYSNDCFWAHHSHPLMSGVKSFSDFIRINKDLFLSGLGIASLSPIIMIFLVPALITLRNWTRLIRYLFLITLGYYIFIIFTSQQSRFFYVSIAAMGIIITHFVKTIWTKYSLTRIPIILCIVTFSVASFSVSIELIESPFFAGLGVLDRRQFHVGDDRYKASMWVNENLPQDSKILIWYLLGYHLEREYIRVSPAFQGVLDFGRITDTPAFLKSIKELGISHLLYQPSNAWLQKHTKEFLDKCVIELLEGGKIALLKQIGSCAIYSVDVPPDYFVLDGDTIRFSDESQRKYLVRGWSSTEEWGTWSEGEESVMLVNFKEIKNEIASPSARNDKWEALPTPTLPSPFKGEDIGGGKDYTMLIKATGFSIPGKQQRVKVYLDDNLLAEHTFTHPVTYFEDIEIKIPLATLSLPSPLEGEEQVGGNHRIKFVYSFTGSPAEHGMGHDVRQLAMGVSSIEFK